LNWALSTASEFEHTFPPPKPSTTTFLVIPASPANGSNRVYTRTNIAKRMESGNVVCSGTRRFGLLRSVYLSAGGWAEVKKGILPHEILIKRRNEGNELGPDEVALENAWIWPERKPFLYHYPHPVRHPTEYADIRLLENGLVKGICSFQRRLRRMKILNGKNGTCFSVI
jgi:hypothetical protein